MRRTYSVLAIMAICVLMVSVVVATPEVRELWKVVEGSGAASGNAWIDSANAGRGIDWIPGAAAGNSSGFDEVAVLTGVTSGSLVQLMRAWDGKNLGSFAIPGTGDSTLQLYRIATSDDGKIFANGFEGSVIMVHDDEASSYTKIINQTGSGTQSRALEVVGTIDGPTTCTIFVGKNLNVEVWVQAGPGSKSFSLAGTVDTGAEGLTGTITSIGAIDDSAFIVCTAIGGNPIKKFNKTAPGVYAFDSDLSTYGAFAKQGLDWDQSDLYVLGEAGGAQDGYGMAKVSGTNISPIAGLDGDADNVYDAGTDDLNAANLAVDMCLNPNSCMGYGYSSSGGAAAVIAIYYDEPVTVTGVDNPPTTFKNMYDALEYLKINNPSDPKRINIITDGPIIETKDIDTRTSCSSGVFIIGDADLNSVPCTVITSPTVGADMVWDPDPRYGVLFDFAMKNAYYVLEDLTVLPSFQGEGAMGIGGTSFGLYPILADENPSGASTGYRLDVTNCVAGGSTAGNVIAADPNNNQFATCTRINGWEFWSHGAGARNILNITELEMYNSDYRGMAFFSDYSEINIGEGMISCWAAEEAISCSGFNSSSLSIVGTADKRNLFRGCGQYDVDEEGGFFSTNAAGQFVVMKYTDFIENGGEIDFNEAVPDLTDNCFFAYNDQGENYLWNCAGMRMAFTNADPKTANVTNCTIHDDKAAANDAGIKFGYAGTDNFTLNCSNVIISGSGDIGIHGRDGAASTVNFSDSALVTAGPDALETATTPGADLVINLVNVTNTDPNYDVYVYTYGSTDDFLRVSNPAYSNAGPGASDLVGAGGPIGPKTRVDDWMLY